MKQKNKKIMSGLSSIIKKTHWIFFGAKHGFQELIKFQNVSVAREA
jgi:hypothetical protein